ncbi:CCR4-Not complex component, Not1, C-terminal [Cynara cardunculus var. scolymus]|uniref:CCR4-Not complex component, Not1, C-terminal n=1 Tax=Cynara cardunculus var. scolymus TaxID=59895 RepID=A0A103XED8_CYNCS|nr:CCR4-Not complex component, Not1, C-terminal [Cynara cardunculus var. scolymus]
MIPLAQRFSTEIRLLFESLNDSNFDSVLRELSQREESLAPLSMVPGDLKMECEMFIVVEPINIAFDGFLLILLHLLQYVDYGTEGSVLLLETCLDHFNVYEKDLKSTRLEPVVASLFRKMLEKPQFSTVFSVSVRPTAITEEFLDNLSIALQLSAYEKLGFGLALTDSENNDIRMAGRNFCMGKIEELFATHTSLHTADCVQDILLFLNKSEVLSKHVDSFMQLLSLVQFDKDSGFILAPLLSDELQDSKLLSDIDFLSEGNDDEFDAILAEMEKEMSMADMLRELGYKCTLDVSLCKDLLSSFSPLTEITVARILGTIVRFDAGLQDHENAFSTFCSALGRGSLSDMSSLNSWNTDVLIESIKQLAPGISWTTVIENLDHEGFYIPDEAAFLLLISCYRHASQSGILDAYIVLIRLMMMQDPFPLAAVCGNIWKNTEGQLSFLKCAVSVPPEVFTFAHCERQVAYVDIANNHKFQSGHANHAWLCLDLLEVLCQLAERGLANSVRLLLEHPLRNCPEVLLFGMAHVNVLSSHIVLFFCFSIKLFWLMTPYNLIQHEVSSVVLPMILKDASLGGILLHLWHVNPPFLLRALNDTLNMDADNTNRVLDIFQELKIVSPVLDMVPMYLGIRLAALASRKELVDLEKWLSMNLSTYRDTFFEECLRFLKEVEFGAHESSNRLHNSSNIWSLYMETAPVFLKVLQSHTSLLSSNQLSKEMERLHLKSTNNSSRMKNNGGPDSSTSEVYADDIETEANSYFQQMFSGVLTIDAMVQMLARFKESSEKREQSIFECMIANLFEEYKFFNRYPDRQLKLAAVLFGLLIKNQLVTHLTLGIALRAVLDALRKPADSKMFVFGTKALEKFVDRLIEWPQYCQHILQISHLRGTHSELVAFIERALARISSGHPESDAGHNPAADQHHNSIPQANIEMAASSFPLIGSGGGQLGSQIPSPIQLQQRNQSYLDERHRASVTSSNYMKPNLTNAGQVSVAPASEPPQSVVSSSAALASSPAFVRPSRGSSARFGSALNIETLVAAAERRETPIEAPPSETQDKISFIINNLSAANIEAKAKEFTEILKEQYYPWFAQYMVMKRASIEPNFHDLYLKFLEKANSKPLNREIVQATYENCKVLLGSELIKSSSEERSLLKNLGGWLGKITIGRNHVLRAKEIDPKALIIEAYEKGLMIAVIPFTSKILEACQSSLAYQPPNPWTMGILGLLAEIYAMPNLKMNLKFEIEVLFKNLNVDLKEVTPTSLLMDRVREIEGNPDFSNKDVGSAQQPMVGEVKSSMISTLNQVELPLEVASSSHPGSHSRILSQYAAPLHLPAATLSEDEKMAALGLSDQLPSAQGLLQAQLPFSVGQLPASNIDQQVIVNPKLQALGLHLHFQRFYPLLTLWLVNKIIVLPMSMDRAIKEIVSSIVQRSVSIATQTTKELVLKDYAMESDESRIHSAAHLMVASLAGSLAHVTCKEPLRGSISSQLRNNLQTFNIASELFEHAIQLATNDNLDLGCALIEQAATEKAVQTIDGELAPQLSIRRKHREGVGPAFFDASLYTQGHVGVLPEALRPKPGRLSHSQQRVYEDFVRLPWQNQSNQNSNAVPLGPSAPQGSGALHRGYGSASGQLNPGIFSSSLGNSGINAVAHSLDPEDIEPSSVKLLRCVGIWSSFMFPIYVIGQMVFLYSCLTNSRNSYSLTFTSFIISFSISSASSVHSGMAGGIGPHNFENEAVLSSFSSVSAPELHITESSNVTKESGAYAQPLPSPSAAASDRIISTTAEPSLTTGDALDKYQIISEKLESLIANDAKETEIQSIIAEVPGVILKCISRDEAALAVAQKVFKGLYENAANAAHVGAHLAMLAAIRDVSKLVVKELTKVATEFAISLIQTLVASDARVISELHNLVDALAKLATRPDAPEALQQLVEIARNPAASSGFSAGKDDLIRQPKDKKVANHPVANRDDSTALESSEPDPAGFHEQVSMLFAEWYRIYELPGVNDAISARFVLQLQQNGLLKADDTSDRFFRRLLDVAVSHCISSEVINSNSLQSHQQAQSLSFLAIDMYASLVFSILKFSPVDHGLSKLSLLSKVLAVTVRFIQKDAEEKKTSFNPRPYFRLFIDWLLDLSTLDPVFEGANFQVLTALATSFHALQPLKVPAFRLVRFLYKGTLRVLLVLLHDFPEFLCDYHFSFCDIIPPSCIQMRNIVLSAFPRNMRLPDPQSPRILSEVDAALKAKQMKSDVDEYLKTRPQGTSFLSELKQKLLLSPNEAARAGTRYNVPLMNSLVLYVGMQAIQQLQARTPHGQSMASNASLAIFLVGAALDIFQTLILELETEGRYLFLNAVANQLRYPNNHTHYFSFILLYLFSESNQEAIQEQITRVLLERLIVNRPHPWGLLITFIELIKNPRYNFWSRSFTRCAPEIEKLFESVSRSCGGPKPVDDNVVADTMH